MKKSLILFTILLSSIFAETTKEKIFHAKDNSYENNYRNSSDIRNIEEQVISSTAEASAEITVAVTVQAITEITSRTNTNQVTMSFLDNNRIQITEDIAKGDGEYISTLLSIMSISKNEKNLTHLQNNLENLIYLSHNDFLEKIKKLNHI